MSSVIPAQALDPVRGAARADRVRRRRFVVRGVVQGVGFRPFVWQLATELGLAGTVHNTSGAVVVEVEGSHTRIDAFARRLRDDAPPLARIDSIASVAVAVQGDGGFRIKESVAVAGEYQPIAADAATCAECVDDVFDRAGRRYRYPFTNCTNCGPRFTIIEDVPYDRPLTTMRSFRMCDPCAREYADPSNRRFHAQPNACPSCGPRLWFAGRDGNEVHGDAIALAVASIACGEIVALKGLGGFQLCCDAGVADAVRRLRIRKRRPAKPFAIMCPTLAATRELCEVSSAEAALLTGTARPIVLLRTRRGAAARVASCVAPGLGEFGVMLPYTPLHHLLLRALERPLVMTSGNLSEEPIARDNDEALTRLGAIADAFLLHDREIHARYDDSVVRVVAETPRMVRRGRGYAPLPLDTGAQQREALALGAHQKNTFCIVKHGRSFVGPHIGDLDTPLAVTHEQESLRTYLHLFRCDPAVVASDLHPDHASTRLAETWWERGAAEVRVQHHHAHIASVLAEHGLRGAVIGVAFDGTGYGPDGTVWGGELLVCDERTYRRAGHIAAVRQPGGELCARQGWRMAAAYLHAMAAPLEPPRWLAGAPGLPEVSRWRRVARVAGSTLAPVSTSAGRLFDAVASLLGVAQISTFEAEAAMRLETVAATVAAADPIAVPMAGSPLVIDTVSLVRELVELRRRGRSAAELAAVFHASLAAAIRDACVRLHADTGLRRVALSGGVFQNALLLGACEELLADREFEVFSNREVPANDGGIALGQALVATSTGTSGRQ